MADPISTFANVSAVLSLVDVVCRAGRELFAFCAAIKDASKDIRYVAEELQQFTRLLASVKATVEQRETSTLAKCGELSWSGVVEALKDCQSDLTELSVFVQKSKPKQQCGKAMNLANKVKWVLDEKKVIRSCQRLERRKLILITALSMIGREYDLRLQEQVELTRQDALTTSETMKLQHQALDNCIKHELGSFQSLSNKVHDSVGKLGKSMETSFSILHDIVQNTKASTNTVQEWNENSHVNVRNMNDELRRAVADTNENTLRGTKTIKAALKRNLKLQTQNGRSQKNSSLRMHQDLMRIQSMLAQFIVSNARNDDLDVDYFRIDGVEVATMIMPLMLMSTHMPSAFSKLADQQPPCIAREDIETFHKEFNQLLAASHEASAKALKGGFVPTSSTSSRSTMKRRVPEGDTLSRNLRKKRRLENFRHDPSVKNQRQVWSQCLATGELSIVVEAQQEERNKSSSAVFSVFFVPRPEICSTGFLAIFKRMVRRASTPKLSRYIRTFNLILGNIGPPQVACMSDDVDALQAMLSAGEITPWDRNEHGWTLLLYSSWSGAFETTRLLLQEGAGHDYYWNCHDILDAIWRGYVTIAQNCGTGLRGKSQRQQSLARWINLSELCIRANISVENPDNLLSRRSLFHIPSFYGMKKSTMDIADNLCKYFLSLGRDIEYHRTRFSDTPLLLAARVPYRCQSWLEALIGNGANIAAKDEHGRGPLHLTLMPYLYRLVRWENSWDISKAVTRKLSLFLKAGCDPSLKDDYSKRPAQYARRYGLLKEWNAVLAKLAIIYDCDDETGDDEGYDEVYLAYDQRCHCFNDDEWYDHENVHRCYYVTRDQRCLSGRAYKYHKISQEEDIMDYSWEDDSTSDEHEQDDDSSSGCHSDDGGVPVHTQGSSHC